MLHVKKLSVIKDPNNSLFLIDKDEIKYMRKPKDNPMITSKPKDNPMMMLSDVFFSKLAHMMGCNAAENDLVEFEYIRAPFGSYRKKELKQVVCSKNFLKQGEIITNAERFFDLKHTPADLYHSKKTSIFQDINLEKFFKTYMERMPDAFKNAFIDTWWLRTYFRDADQYHAHNVGVVYKNSSLYLGEAAISPAYDFEYCMLSSPAKMELDRYANENNKTMNRGLHPANVDFLKNEYRDLSEKFLGSVDSVTKKPEFDSLCEFSHLASFFTEVAAYYHNEARYHKQEYQNAISEKLTEVSGDVRKNCLKRGNLLLSQWR